MVRKTLIGTALALFVLTLASLTLWAQSPRAQTIHVTPSPDVTPADNSDAGLMTIFSNLGPSTTNEYYDVNGYCVTGNNQTACGTTEQWIAMPFTPLKASHATMLQAAIGVLAGTNQFQLSLYNDVSGAPGTSLKTVTVKNAPTFGTCCKLVAANLGSPGIALTAGTQYWVVFTADDVNAPTFAGAWAFTNFANIGVNAAQAGWTESQDLGAEAGAVKGTIP